MPHRHAIGLASGALALLLSGRAHAASVDLTWNGPPECSRQGSVLERVTELVGGVETAPFVAVANVTPSGHGYRVSLHVDNAGETGVRDFEGSSCRAVTEATALVIAVLLAPVETAEVVEAGRPLRPGPAPSPGPPPPSLTPDPEPVVHRPVVESRSERASWRIGARLGFGVGAVPAASGFAGGEASVAFPWLRIGLVGRVWMPRQEDGGPRQGAGVLVGLATLGPTGCLALVRSVVILEGCVGVDLGVQYGAGQLLRAPLHAYLPWFDVAPGLALRTAGSRLPAFLALDLPVSLARPTFSINDFGPIYAAPVVGFRASLGLDLAF